MSETFAAWQRHPAHRNLELPTDPAGRDRYIVKVAGSWRRNSESELNAAITEWQASTGKERASWRKEVAARGARYRSAMRLYHDVWMAFCRGHRMAREAA